MKIYTALQKGKQHKNFCEDFLLTLQVSDELFVGAVSDGCSSGRDAHLASALTCKLIRKIVTAQPLADDLNPEEIGDIILTNFMRELRQAKHQLHLATDELLATLMLLVVNKKVNQAYIASLGDGAISFDGSIYQIDQDNMPDYPAYHLKDTEEDLQNYLYRNTFNIENPAQISIATDGVFTFRYQRVPDDEVDFSYTDYLLKDEGLAEYENMLARKLFILKDQHHVEPVDDVAIIRLVVR
jgi:Protein phosphatase 2C